MSERPEPRNLEELCDRIEEAEAEAEAEDDDRVKVGLILNMVGRRSFGPLLLVAGMMAILPFVGDIPGVTTSIGVLVFLITIQLLIGREYFWLPQWLLERSVTREKLCKALAWVRTPARAVDRVTRPRLEALTQGAAIYVMAIACIAIALVMPAMELVPFGANVAGAALTMFGLSMIAHDGLVALLAFMFTALTFGLAGYGLLQ